jgi:hypothetical protein
VALIESGLVEPLLRNCISRFFTGTSFVATGAPPDLAITLFSGSVRQGTFSQSLNISRRCRSGKTKIAATPQLANWDKSQG